VQGHEHPALLSRSLHAADCSWVAGAPPTPGRLAAKTRYRQADAACDFVAEGQGFSLRFDDAQWAVTAGQSAVLYDGEVCLGGGVIDSADAPQPFTTAAPAAAPRRAGRPAPSRRPVPSR
jgi:tRNA-uridine 2-sulfurtransferase